VIRYNANDNPAKQAAFSQYDRPKAKSRYAEIAAHLGLGGEDRDASVRNLLGWVEGLKRDLEVPATIQAAGVAEAEFLAKVDAIAEEAFDDQCTGANPRFPLISELRTLLVDSYYGRPFVEAGGPESSEAGGETRQEELAEARA
jgi:acetaldehyde dehydrogenase/alcohol dehydrogenase